MNHAYDGERCIFCGVNYIDAGMHPDAPETCNDREPMVYTTETPAPVVVARFLSLCETCEEPISPGDPITPRVQYDSTWRHFDCDAARAARPERGVVCAECGEVQPCRCDDLAPVWTIQ